VSEPSADAPRPWRIATRRSALARTQAAEVGRSLTEATGRPVELVPLATTGDEHPDRAVESFETKGLFVDGTRRAVLDGDCDLVVHSHKDLPSEPHPDLLVAAIPARVDPRDALISRAGWRLAELPRDRQVTVGTSAPRRRAQLQRHRRDILVQPLRGNLDTRLSKVADGTLDAVVVALAGLLRLRPRIEGLVVVPLEHGELLHAPAQGALALECRRDDAATRAALAGIDDDLTRTEVTAERELLLRLQGGCTAPIGAHAELRTAATGQRRLVLLGMVADPNGTSLHRASHEAAPEEAQALGRAMASTLLEAGGDRILARLRAEQRTEPGG